MFTQVRFEPIERQLFAGTYWNGVIDWMTHDNLRALVIHGVR